MMRFSYGHFWRRGYHRLPPMAFSLWLNLLRNSKAVVNLHAKVTDSAFHLAMIEQRE